MGFRFRGTFTNDDDQHTAPVYQQNNVTQGHYITPSGSWHQIQQPQYYQQAHPMQPGSQITPTRFLRRTKYEEVETNDSKVNLERSMGGVSNKLINVGTGLAAALLVGKVALGILSGFAFLLVVCLGGFLGYQMFNSKDGGQGGNGAR